MIDVEPRPDNEPSPASRGLGADGLEALQELSDALAHADSDEGAFRQALGNLQSVLGLPCVAILLLESDRQMRCHLGRGFSEAAMETVEACCPWSVKTQKPQPVLVENLPQEPSPVPCPVALLAEGIESLAFIPILSQGQLLGELMLGSRIKHCFTSEEIRFTTTVANLLGLVIARNGRDGSKARQSLESLRVSEEKFSKIFHLSPDAIDLTRTDDGVSLDCNNSYVKLSGYSREEIIGHATLPGDLSVWVRPEDRDRHVAGLRERGEVLEMEVPLRRKDGSIYTALISSCMVEINGQPCNLTLTRDISERKKAEEALHESTQRLRLALASGHLGIWDRNLLDDTEIWDERMYEIYGIERRSLVPNYENWAARILHPDDAPRIEVAIQAALAGAQPYDLNFRIVRPDGCLRHIGSNGMVIRDVDGRAVRVIGINRDRTQQVEAEAERRRLQAEVHHAEKLESIGSLAGGVAHDLNNVLTAILITTEMLHEECLPGDPMARSLAVILHAGQRGRDLVKALTDFARKGLEETSPVDLNELLRNEVELLRHTTLKKIHVVLDLDEQLPVILGAASELGSALMNLSINAVDAMPEGGTLTFRSRALPDGWIELAVADTGQGMTPDVMAKAMEPFFTTKPLGKGTGLGLSRVYGTLRAHGGAVEIRSEAGEGTSIILRLPTSQGRYQGPAPAFGPVSEAPHNPLRILFVDDEGILLETIPALLESIGHTVETASLGEEALRRLDLCPDFDLVILDHNMPGLTGVETLIQLRRKHSELPVLLSSGFLDTKTEALLEDIPQVWVLKKPYKIQEIKRTLAEIAQVVPRIQTL